MENESVNLEPSRFSESNLLNLLLSSQTQTFTVLISILRDGTNEPNIYNNNWDFNADPNKGKVMCSICQEERVREVIHRFDNIVNSPLYQALNGDEDEN